MNPANNGSTINRDASIELENPEEYQPYNLSEDIGQQNNLAKSNPEKLKVMLYAFVAIRDKGFENSDKLELY